MKVLLTEKKHQNLRAYIFNELPVSFEAKTDNATVDEHGTEHTAVLKLLPGKKKVYVVANMQDELDYVYHYNYSI